MFTIECMNVNMSTWYLKIDLKTGIQTLLVLKLLGIKSDVGNVAFWYLENVVKYPFKLKRRCSENRFQMKSRVSENRFFYHEKMLAPMALADMDLRG